MADSLHILQWNARSLSNNITEFKNYLYTRSPHIVAICETWLDHLKRPKFSNYSIYRQDRSFKKGGCLVILVRKDIAYLPFSLKMYEDGILEIFAIKVIMANKEPLYIFSGYCAHPNGTINVEFTHYVSQVPRNCKLIVCGDFNVRHPIWDSNVVGVSRAAQSLLDFFLSSNYVLLTTKNLNTRYDIHNNLYSTIDLMFASAFLADKASISIGKNIGSDHLPVHVELTISPTKIKQVKRQTWKIPIDETKWLDWEKHLQETELPNLDDNNIEDCLQTLTTAVTDASIKTFGLTKAEINSKTNKPWWTVECKKQVALRLKLRRIYERRLTIENKINYKKQSAITRRTIRAAKRSSWQSYISDLSFTTPSSQIWKMIRNINGTNKIQTLQTPLFYNNQHYSSDSEKAQIIGECLQKQIGQSVLLNIDNSQLPKYDKTYKNPTIGHLDNYNATIGEHEYFDTLQKYATGKGMAMGIDKFHKTFLLHLPSHYKECILHLFNKIWDTGYIPKSWKSSLIYPLANPDKDLSNPENVRPISFLSCIGKLLEKIICNRLYWISEQCGIIKDTQCGFRKHHNSLDQVLALETFIRQRLVKKHHAIVLFIDLKKAFDSIPHDALLTKLNLLGLQGKMMNYLTNFLTDRHCQVIVGNNLSETFHARRGVPQGSVLSPLLFSIYGVDIPVSAQSKNSEYADDIAFYAGDSSIDLAETKLQMQLDKFLHWCTTWGLQINIEKTKLLHFTMAKKFTHPKVQINGQEIAISKTYKFLGMIFDAPLLTWKEHIDHLFISCNKRLNILKCITSKRWGADKKVSLQFFKTYILGKINYGARIYNSATDTHKRKLDLVQNAALRLITGAMRSTPLIALQRETQCLPLQYCRDVDILKNFYKIRSQNKTMLLKKLFVQTMDKLLNTNWTKLRKPHFFTMLLFSVICIPLL